MVRQDKNIVPIGLRLSVSNRVLNSRWLPATALIALFAAQALYLDSDPSFLKRLGDFGDEGYWQHNARSHALFGIWLPDELNGGLIGGPLFNLIQRIVFSFGVSLFTARLLPLAAFWLVLLMTYELVRRELPRGWSLTIVLSLSVMHELLMYAKWSTPVVPEGCCLLGVFFFSQRAKEGTPAWMFLAGLSWAAAFAMKLSAVYSVLGIAMYLLGGTVRGEFDGKKWGWFIGGTSLGMTALAVFLLGQFDQFVFFCKTIVAGDVQRHVGIREALTGIFLFPLNSVFCYPSTVMVSILASLWACGRLVCLWRVGALRTLREMSSAEFLCVCWLVGSALMLGISPDKADRRYVMLLVPLTVLAGIFVYRQFTCPADNKSGLLSDVLPARWLPRMCFATICILYWTAALRNALHLTVHSAIDFDLRGHRAATWTVGLVMAMLLAGLPLLLGKIRVLACSVVASFFVMTLALDGLWYACATWTVRDTSRSLAAISAEPTYLFGGLPCHELALENRLHPIWTPFDGIPMNHWFAKQMNDLPCVEGVDDDDPSFANPSLANSARHLQRDRAIVIGRVNLCPVPLVGRFRWRGVLYTNTTKAARESEPNAHVR